MNKPWLLLSPEGKKERKEAYLRLTSSGQIVDEVLIQMVKPPENMLEAMLELFIYQARKK